MKVTKAAAVALFEALGVKTAAKWTPKRLSDKLAKVNDLVDEDTDLEGEVAKTLTAVQEAIENGEGVEVEGQKKASGGAKKDADKKDTPAKGKGKKDDDDDEAKPEKPKKPSTPGVRNSRTRPFLAGVLIKKHGRKAGVTDEMVAELDEMYGKENPAESMFCLRNAWHAIRGFMDGDDQDEE